MDSISYYLQTVLNGILAGCIYALFAMGLTLIYGVLNFVNFAHGELIMWGAYFLFLFMGEPFGLPLYVAVFPALALTGCLGLAMDYSVFRPIRRANRLTLLIAAMGLSVFLRNAAQLFWGAEVRTYGFEVMAVTQFLGLYLTTQQFAIIGVTILCVIAVYLLFFKSRLGKSMRALSDNLDLARISGIDTKRAILAAWVISAVLAAIGGILLALDTNLHPEMGITNLIKAFAATLIGGVGNLWGALLGGLLIGLAENIGVLFISPGYKDGIAFLIMVLILLARGAQRSESFRVEIRLHVPVSDTGRPAAFSKPLGVDPVVLHREFFLDDPADVIEVDFGARPAPVAAGDGSDERLTISAGPMVGEQELAEQVLPAPAVALIEEEEQARGADPFSRVQHEAGEETAGTVNEMLASIKGVAENAAEMSAAATDASSSATEMVASIEEVATSANGLSSAAEDTASSIVQTLASIRQVSENTETLASAAEQTSASITELGASVKAVEQKARESALAEKVARNASDHGMAAAREAMQGMENIRGLCRLEQLGLWQCGGGQSRQRLADPVRHLSAYNVVCGQSVYQGNVIGAIGSTGNSSGSHLHFEVMYNGGKVNPWDYLP